MKLTTYEFYDLVNRPKPQLTGLDLSGMCLDDFNLYEAKLQRCNLVGTTLRRAYLLGANLNGADLSGCDLSESNLHGADFSNVNLTGAVLPDRFHEIVKSSQGAIFGPVESVA